MPIDEAFESSTDKVLLDMAQRPRPPQPQTPSFSMWKTTTAAPKGLAAGAAEGTGSIADVLGAFGDVLGAYPEAMGPVQLTEQQKQEANAAREKLLSSGPSYNTEAGRLFRNVGKDYMPDPVTAHGAETAVANLFRVGGKAVTAAATLGVVPGAIAAGAEEGFTTSDELGQHGVDLGTRSAVGAVTGVVNAVGFALPVAGQTVKATVGLALAGGPASFVVQNAASREILKRANYTEQANQFDPFDPVGLTLSTLLPLGFGAMALRGMKAKARVDAEAVEAARVSVQREHIDSVNPAPIGDLAGAAAHEASLTRAMDQMAAGEKVEVTDVAPAVVDTITPAVAERLQPLVKAFEEEVKVRDAQPDIAAALEGQQSITDKLGERYRVTVHEETLGAAKDTQGVFVQVFDPISGQRRARIDFAVNKDGTLAAENTNVAPSYQRRGIAQAMYQTAIDAGYKIVPGRKQTDVGAKMVDSLQSKGLIGGKKPAAPKAAEAPASKAPAFKSESPELDRAVKELEDLSPDHPVMLDGMTAPMSVRELMARVRQEASQDASEAGLIEAAANCFLRTSG
jgi:GNAT superfamily N-acetyltransferase